MSFVNVGPNHLFRVNGDIESWVRLCSVCLMVKKTSPGLEFGSVWWLIMVVYGMVVLLVVCNLVVYCVVVLLVARELPAAITGNHLGSPIDFGAIFWKIFLEEKNR